jgi:hypothetical protein
MLAERHERHGLAGTVVIKYLRTPSDAIRRHRLAEEVQLAKRLHPRAVLHRALRKEPSERFMSAGDLCAALRECLAVELASVGLP